ncbi:MAG: aminoglycoside 6-adenylyltransferase [Chloroflexi bacterium]|nr:aminoglycoside 6-adenylyltransferase [Chloroflexota bacterium]
MRTGKQEQEVISKLIQWAQEREDIRAMVLTSSRTNPKAQLDMFSDFDVIVIVRDIHPFLEDESWLSSFGKVLVVYRDPVQLEYGFERFCRVTHYEDGTKIDYTVWPTELLQHIVKEPKLPAYLDNGYEILLDKDRLTEHLKTPTYTAYIPTPPSEKDYLTTIEEFFNDAIYVAKNVFRGNLFITKLCLDHIMKEECLRKMLEWQMEIDHGWALTTGAHGKGLRQHVDPEVWTALESTYVGAGHEENWQALFTTISVFRKVASEVADHLGYSYPQDLDDEVVKYLREIKNVTKSVY